MQHTRGLWPTRLSGVNAVLTRYRSFGRKLGDHPYVWNRPRKSNRSVVLVHVAAASNGGSAAGSGCGSSAGHRGRHSPLPSIMRQSRIRYNTYGYENTNTYGYGIRSGRLSRGGEVWRLGRRLNAEPHWYGFQSVCSTKKTYYFTLLWQVSTSPLIYSIAINSLFASKACY